MKRMNKKGFTLIELLTVIAILAVILLIAAPTILNVLEKARKNTFKNQVLLYVESMKTQIALDSLGQSDMADTDLVWSDGDPANSVPAKYTYDISKKTLPMDTDVLTGGTITATAQSQGKYTYSLTNVTNGDYTIANCSDVSDKNYDWLTNIKKSNNK